MSQEPNNAAPAPIGAWGHLRNMLVTGLIALIPLLITLYFLKIIYGVATEFSRPLAVLLTRLLAWAFVPARVVADAEQLKQWEPFFKTFQDWATPVVALLISFLVVYGFGLLMQFVIGRRVLKVLEATVRNLPVVNIIYGTVKQLVAMFNRGGGGQGFQRVVLIEFPQPGMWAVGFITGTIYDHNNGQTMLSVFIPLTPNPTSGFYQIVSAAQVRETDWSIDQGIKIILSGGLLAPKEIGTPIERGEEI
ncbi:MAG: DUF502 domain-containing protein [Phycisphaerae bacterium]